MIKNDLELEITNERLSEFLEASQDFDSDEGMQKLAPEKQEILRNSILGEVELLQKQVDEYCALKRGQVPNVEICNIIDLPEIIIKYRIAKGICQSELAQKLGISEADLVDLEENLFSDVDGELMNRIIATLEIIVPKALTEMLHQYSEDIATGVGREIKSVWERLVPRELIHGYNQTQGYLKLYLALQKVFRELTDQIILRQPLNYTPLVAVRYKVPQGVAAEKVYAHTAYASHIANVVSNTVERETGDLTEDPKQFKQSVISAYGRFNLKTCVSYLWDLGVPVVPMKMKGGFHGACWRFNGKNVIVLKQNSKSNSRWIFDLLHEYWHATQERGFSERNVVDLNDVLSANVTDPEEIDANAFANNVIFNGKANELIRECYVRTNSRIERFKRVVPIVARQHHVNVGALANLVAYDLSLRGENWWGSSQNLQNLADPYNEVFSIFVDRIDLNKINDVVDREILQNAIEW